MRLLALTLLGALSMTIPAVASAQAAPVPGVANVPTTKVLAIGRIVQMPDAAKMQSIMPHEVTDTVKLFLGGKIDAWYSRKDERGVVFVMNVTSVEEAHALLEKLPLGVEGVMKFDLIPLGPLGPLNYLLAPAAKP